jgi:hypothetical protein
MESKSEFQDFLQNDEHIRYKSNLSLLFSLVWIIITTITLWPINSFILWFMWWLFFSLPLHVSFWRSARRSGESHSLLAHFVLIVIGPFAFVGVSFTIVFYYIRQMLYNLKSNGALEIELVNMLRSIDGSDIRASEYQDHGDIEFIIDSVLGSIYGQTYQAKMDQNLFGKNMSENKRRLFECALQVVKILCKRYKLKIKQTTDAFGCTYFYAE